MGGAARGSSRGGMGGAGRARRSTGLRSSRRSVPRKKGPCTSGEEAAPEKSSRCGSSSSRSSQEAAASNKELPSVRSALPLMHGRLDGCTPGKAARLRYSSVTKLWFNAAGRSGAGRRVGAERGGAGRRTTTGAKALYFGSHETLSSDPRTCGPAHMALRRWATPSRPSTLGHKRNVRGRCVSNATNPSFTSHCTKNHPQAPETQGGGEQTHKTDEGRPLGR